MRRVSIGIISILYITCFITSCYYDKVIPEMPPEIDGEISFSNDIIPVFNENCNSIGCHNSGGIPPELTAAVAYFELVNGNYLDIQNPSESELYQWMIGNRSLDMPPSGTNASDNQLVLTWIEQGADNN